jgi:two-component system, OmpR family, sensor kinase
MLLRTRLVLLFVTIATIAIGAFSILVFQETRSGVLREIGRDIRARAKSLGASISIEANGRMREPGLAAAVTPGTSVQIVDAQGGIVAREGELADSRIPFLAETFRSGEEAEVRIDDNPYLVFGAPIREEGRIVGYAVVARSPGPLYQVLHRLRGALVIGAPAALVVAGVTVWLMVNHSMGSLRRLADGAADIARRQDHTGRVVTGKTRADEIGRLAASIDSMLEALEKGHHELAESNEAQRRFLADISHELRAPLTIMLSSLELLQKAGDTDPEFTERTLAGVQSETARLATMVGQLLIMARTGANAGAANRPVLVGDVVADLCDQWRKKDSEVSFSYRGLEDLEEAVVHGNEDYLRQLLTILLDNAFKFTPPGGRVTVEGALDSETVWVAVSDTGVGIKPSEVSRIFERFYRANNVGSTDGTGLGLSIARHIAAQHGGRIEVDSAPDRGSRFTVTLPLVME